MISIALCTYNGESFLREQLDSIAQQALLPGELVVCDDCSNDSTMEILQEFKENTLFPVHIYQNENNLGSSKNFEKAIKLCSGDIIALCDQDDVWKPHKLKRLVEVLQDNPEAGYVFSDANLVDENVESLGFQLWDTVGFKGQLKERFLKGEQLHCFIKKRFVTGATMAFPATIGKLAMPFPANWIHDGWIALVSSATGYFGIPVDETLIYYRQHSSQQIGTPSQPLEKNKQSLIDMYRELKKNHQALWADWEMQCLRLLTLENVLSQFQEDHTSPMLEQNIALLQKFETHYHNRRKILTSKGPGRYKLIFQEAFSGRYGEFSDSWRSIFRDLFL